MQRGGGRLYWRQHQGLSALARSIAAPQPLPELQPEWEWPGDRYGVI